MEEFLQAVIEGRAEVVIGGANTLRSLVLDFSGLRGDFAFELFQAFFVVAALLADGEQVAALGIEQEEQAIEEGEGAVEVGFEQAIALLCGQVFQASRKL